jgi:hypothetical protein
VSTPPGELPGPPPAQVSTTPTHVAGQEHAPTNAVPPPPPGTSYTPASSAHTNSLAIVSLVAGIGSFFAHIIPGIGGLTVAVIAVITGYMARNQIKQSGEQGMWMATAGMIIGIAHIALLAIVVIVVLFLIFVLGIALFGVAAHSTH